MATGKSKILSIVTTESFNIPANITVIRNDGVFVTLARKSGKSNVELFTCAVEEFSLSEIENERSWSEFTKEELDTIVKLKYIK